MVDSQRDYNDEEEDNSDYDDLNDWSDEPSDWEKDDAKRKRGKAIEVEPFTDEDAQVYRMSRQFKTTKRSADAFLDNLLSRATGTAERSRAKLDEYKPKLKRGAKLAAKKTRYTFDTFDKLGDKYSRRIFTTSIFDSVITFIIRNPILILVVVGIITAGAIFGGIVGYPLETNPEGQLETRIQNNIRGDFEVYLPQNHETKIILDDIQVYWSTDIIIIFVETRNARPVGSEGSDPWSSTANITDIAVLKEMSRFEEKFDYLKDADKDDDGIVFILSFSTIVKEINSTPPRFKKAVEEEFANLALLPPLGVMEGGYSIPDDQNRIDSLFEQVPESSRKKLILDSNDDSIYDTGIILIGITQDIDQELLVKNMNEEIENYNQTKMTLTGPIPMTQAITKRTYSEFMKTLPAAIVLVAAILVLFHRNLKIVLITGIPVLCSLAITFGILGGANLTLTPQVVLIAPILIALGVAYGLYIANRYSDESQIKDREERIRVAVKTTGKAVFLSALTTAIGFASLLTVSMIPLQILGLGLSMGIMICYVITMLTVPSLVMALNYQKKAEVGKREKIGNVPIKHRKKIVVIAVIFVIISVALIPSVVANMNFIKMAPQDEEVILKMREYSNKFGGGQQGMIMVTGMVPSDDNVHGSMYDPNILYEVDRLESEINKVENTNAISITDFMKMIKLPEPENPTAQEFIDALEIYLGIDYNTSFWNIIQTDIPGLKEERMVRIFYNTLSTEMRGMFVNSDYSRTLLYIDMPTMDVVNTKKAVNEVNEITDKKQWTIEASHLTGFGAILVAVNDMLVVNSIQSTILALILVLIVLALIFKSIKFSAITLIPVCFVVILQPITLIGIGSFGSFINPSDPYFSGELNLFTAVLGSIIVGIGIDFGIHMTERIRERGLSFDGIRHGVATSGWAFVEATVTMIGGLTAVFLIEIPAIQEFILLVMILLTYSVIGALFILTAIYAIIVRRNETKAERLKQFETPFKGGYSDSRERIPLKASGIGLDSGDK